MAATIGGVDLIVFTGGIGENSPTIRAGVIKQLSWLGVSLSSEANDRRAERSRRGIGN
jgi:acetate kinase